MIDTWRCMNFNVCAIVRLPVLPLSHISGSPRHSPTFHQMPSDSSTPSCSHSHLPLHSPHLSFSAHLPTCTSFSNQPFTIYTCPEPLLLYQIVNVALDSSCGVGLFSCCSSASFPVSSLCSLGLLSCVFIWTFCLFILLSLVCLPVLACLAVFLPVCQPVSHY